MIGLYHIIIYGTSKLSPLTSSRTDNLGVKSKSGLNSDGGAVQPLMFKITAM